MMRIIGGTFETQKDLEKKVFSMGQLTKTWRKNTGCEVIDVSSATLIRRAAAGPEKLKVNKSPIVSVSAT
jgi:hypothetical protein